MNSIHCTICENEYGTWVFDDPDKGLYSEPFVMGSSEAINHVIGVANAEKVKIIHSKQKFPNASHYLVKMFEEDGGYWYELIDAKTDESENIPLNWLCPATKKFYGAHPQKIWMAASIITK